MILKEVCLKQSRARTGIDFPVRPVELLLKTSTHTQCCLAPGRECCIIFILPKKQTIIILNKPSTKEKKKETLSCILTELYIKKHRQEEQGKREMVKKFTAGINSKT